MLLQAFYSVRSERQLMERSSSTYCSAGSLAPASTTRYGTIRAFRRTVTDCWKVKSPPNSWPRCCRSRGSSGCCRASIFSVDGTLIQAWASIKSVKPKQPSSTDGGRGGGRNALADFHGQKRSNETHRRTTDPDARLYHKGPGMEARLCFIGRLMKNCSGLIVDARLTRLRPRRAAGGARHGTARRRPAVRGHPRCRPRRRRRRFCRGIAA
jgi:hypothetical protein